jgi:hypothetical protein
MKIKTFMMACGLAVCLLAQPAVAGPFEDGLVAYFMPDNLGDESIFWKTVAAIRERREGNEPRSYDLE